MPETGDLRQVPAVPTRLDVSGFEGLYNRAVQVVDRPGALALEDFLRAKDVVSLSFESPEPSEEYNTPAAMFASHAAVETDDGRSVFNFNLGNITVTRGDYYLNPKVTAPLRFGNYNFPLQGAVAHVARIKRLWPEAYKAAFSGNIDGYASALQSGALKYAGNVGSAQLAAAIRARATELGFAGKGVVSVLAGGARNLRRGMRGRDVAQWQRFLGVVVDGIFGLRTMRATKVWQSAHNLEPDGIVGPKTREMAGQ